MPPLVSIRDLRVAFNGVPVLLGVDIVLQRGEALGLVGESGSGKSVTWLAALGLLPRHAHVTGSVQLEGREILGAPAAELDHVRGGRIAMIFQDPASALNPVLTIRKQLCEALALHRDLQGSAVKTEARRLLELVGIPDAARRLEAYPHEFSGGQIQRIMIAMALAGNPDLLIADEPTTALDATIQAQILELLSTVRRELGMAMVLISHDLGVVAENCDRVAVMYAGRLVEDAPSNQLFADPVHPYAQGLIGALPPLDGPRRRLTAIPGTVPDPAQMPSGCAFAPRCALAAEPCGLAAPSLAPIANDRSVACIRAEASRRALLGIAAE
ncbi:ABC transporter ATP-binding protein [Bradyrhizobium sp. STM 3561]|uniref:ABC transporter ATP-binding protein n=1 Tax=Bradyrhizobium sp. STM 3561 TaxID=578923 RepID=UPI00388E4BB9